MSQEFKKTIQTSVFSDYQADSEAKIFNNWMANLNNNKQVSSPRFNNKSFQNSYFKPRKLNTQRSSIDNFTLGQIEETSDYKNHKDRIDTYPNILQSEESIEKLLDNNKENVSINSNMQFSATRDTNRSKSYLNAMKALQEKSRRLEEQKNQVKTQLTRKCEQFAKSQRSMQQKILILTKDVQQRLNKETELKNLIYILEERSRQTESLIKQKQNLEQSKSKKQKKLKNAERLCQEYMEKYKSVVSQYEHKCSESKQAEAKLIQTEKQNQQLHKEIKKLKEKIKKNEDNQQETKSKFIEKYNSLMIAYEKLLKENQKAKQNLETRKRELKEEIKKLSDNHEIQIKKQQAHINNLLRENQVIKQKGNQLQIHNRYLREQLDKKGEELVQFFKSNLNLRRKQYEEKPQTVINHKKQLKIMNQINEHFLNKEVQELQKCQQQTKQELNTGRFDSKSSEKNNQQFKKQMKDSRISKKKHNRRQPQQQLRLKQEKSESKPFSKSTAEYDRPKMRYNQDSNLITFQNLSKSKSKYRTPLINQSSYIVCSQPRQFNHARNQISVKQFENEHNCLNNTQYNTKNEQTFCSRREHNPGVNKILLNQAQRQSLRLIDEHERLMNLSKESLTSEQRSQYFGRLKQLSEQIKINSEKIVTLKQKQNAFM